MPDTVQRIELDHLEHAVQGGGFRILMIDDNTAVTPREEALFIQLYEAGDPWWEIAEKMRRTQKVITVLAYELIEEGKIKRRRGGVWGKEWSS